MTRELVGMEDDLERCDGGKEVDEISFVSGVATRYSTSLRPRPRCSQNSETLVAFRAKVIQQIKRKHLDNRESRTQTRQFCAKKLPLKPSLLVSRPRSGRDVRSGEGPATNRLEVELCSLEKPDLLA